MTSRQIFVHILFLMCCVSLPAQHDITGKASYYSDKLHGRRMSNGEKYHRDSMTCAHLKYPFGTILKVRNPINNKEVFVEVTDRGPHSRRYIIDLSKAAARELGFIRQGFCQVEITQIYPLQIPFRPEDVENIPELHLEYQDLAVYPIPVWQQEDSLRNKRPKPIKIKPNKNNTQTKGKKWKRN